MNETTEKSWVGTSMDDMYYGQGPWHFEVQPVNASRYHAVLYQLPATLTSPPKPYFSSRAYHWDDDHVRMPFSSKNLFPVEDENGEEVLNSRWNLIQVSLLQNINSSQELEVIVNSYNTRLPRFMALHNFVEEVSNKVLEESENQQFFELLLPGIVRLALQLPEILPGSLPLLKQGSCRSISLSQLQIASLLANAFLCTFPWKKDPTSNYPGINFQRLFSAFFRPKRQQAVAEKLKCLCHYFRRVLSAEPVGVVTFERKHFPKSLLPRWDRLDSNLGNTRIHVSSTGVIEDNGDGLLQVDFANKNVGGGVLAFGCVQEEIRYIICPELIVSRLFTEQLGPTEALVVTGAERYSAYTGYGDSFLWAGNYHDETPYDSSSRRRSSIVAIDATRFTKPLEQYNPSCILRELNKAYVGFHSRLDGQLPAVATGNWGCGAFHGDPKLKFLIQLMACSAARRDMVYFTFSDTELRDNIYEMYLFLAMNQITITQLWRYLCRFASANIKPELLYSFIKQSHFDAKNQPSIKKFYFHKEKSNNKDDVASTSKANDNVTQHVVDDPNFNIMEEGVVLDLEVDAAHINSSPDIIESSQNEDKTSKMPRNEQNDILRFFNMIDEADEDKTEKHTTNVMEGASLLSPVNKFIKKKAPAKRDDVEVMDVDDRALEGAKSQKHLAQKHKITDYFLKIDKG